jgi:hypothetical protein
MQYWLVVILLVLTACSFFSGVLALATAFVFTFLVPGLTFHRFFHLKKHELWAFIPVFSVLISVTMIYFVSLAAGYSATTILGCFFGLTAVYGFVVYKKGETFTTKKILKIKNLNKINLSVFAAIFVLSLLILYSTVWVQTPSGLVITGSNGGDTALHYGIIESINQGNFPPQFPDYAGVKMTYHYFVDFHTAILEQMYGYLPKLLPVLNAVFILIFALSMYALAREFGRKAALVATIVGVFGWGFSYFGLFSALLGGQFNSATNYIYQFGETFGVPSVFDNLIQQRPMLIGLPAFALVLVLLRNPESKRRLLLAGLITGLVFEFSNVAFFCCGFAFLLMVALNFGNKRLGRNYLFYLVPSALALPFIFQGGTPLMVGYASNWILNFAKNPFTYYFLNLGIPLIIALFSLVKKGNNLLKATFILLILIPNFIMLTPNPWDMYKFLIFAWVPIAALFGWFLMEQKNGKTNKTVFSIPKISNFKIKLGDKSKVIIISLLILFSLLTSVSVLTFNLGTNTQVATQSEVQLGMWVRSNTQKDSVFLTYPSVYSPPAFIGGRITVSAYVSWPYGHGIPIEQILDRGSDIDKAYKGTTNDLKTTVIKYNVSYVYVGLEELREYSGVNSKFENITWLTNIYNMQDLNIYQVNWAKIGS